MHVRVRDECCDTDLKLVGLPSADYLRHEEIGVEKVHVLIQESMENQQTVGSERHNNVTGLKQQNTTALTLQLNALDGSSVETRCYFEAAYSATLRMTSHIQVWLLSCLASTNSCCPGAWRI